MEHIYASTAGFFLVLSVLTGVVYVRGRERSALGLTAVCVVLFGTAVADAVNPALLPWLVPVTFAGLAASWWLARGGTKGA
jgi:hypothetical protein